MIASKQTTDQNRRRTMKRDLEIGFKVILWFETQGLPR
jgi:hypothetical protein